MQTIAKKRAFFMDSLCEFLKCVSDDIISTIRLGKKKVDEEGNPVNRPLKIIFSCEKSNYFLMRNAKKLQNAKAVFQCLSIAHDMSKKEREKNL